MRGGMHFSKTGWVAYDDTYRVVAPPWMQALVESKQGTKKAETAATALSVTGSIVQVGDKYSMLTFTAIAVIQIITFYRESETSCLEWE